MNLYEQVILYNCRIKVGVKIDYRSYTIETKRYFSNIIRAVFGDEPKSIKINDENEIQKILIDISEKINLNKEKMSYIWWWRLGNNGLNKFEINGEYLYLNYWKLKIKEIYINISPISMFDFIIFRVKGEENDIPDIENYLFNNNGAKIDLNKHTLHDFSIKKTLENDIDCFLQPYNFILTAQFGLPNLDIYADEDIDIMMNKLLFEKIDYEDFTSWYSEILFSLKKKVDEFYKYIVEFPMLALNHKLGKEIHESIRNFNKYELSDQIFYRARALEKNSPYDEKNMWNPPSDKVAIYEGRYNHFGQSFLYMAADEETAFKEVIPQWHSSCSMIKIKLQKSVKLLDLRRRNFYKEESSSLEYILLHYMLVHEGTISQETKNSYVKPEYVVPRFLADCARSYKFEGILFNSTKHKGINLVLFEPELLKSEGKIITFEKPYIYNKIINRI